MSSVLGRLWITGNTFDPSVDVISKAEALEDFIASDCRFINLKKGQMIYVYSKLKPAEGAGVFWSGSVSITAALVCDLFLSLHQPALLSMFNNVMLRQNNWLMLQFQDDYLILFEQSLPILL